MVLNESTHVINIFFVCKIIKCIYIKYVLLFVNYIFPFQNILKLFQKNRTDSHRYSWLQEYLCEEKFQCSCSSSRLTKTNVLSYFLSAFTCFKNKERSKISSFVKYLCKIFHCFNAWYESRKSVQASVNIVHIVR